uniref:hypothetical protein n=1 Tax=Litorimonas sp. TaxID=1892381 RepID=UPI003A89C78A
QQNRQLLDALAATPQGLVDSRDLWLTRALPSQPWTLKAQGPVGAKYKELQDSLSLLLSWSGSFLEPSHGDQSTAGTVTVSGVEKELWQAQHHIIQAYMTPLCNKLSDTLVFPLLCGQLQSNDGLLNGQLYGAQMLLSVTGLLGSLVTYLDGLSTQYNDILAPPQVTRNNIRAHGRKIPHTQDLYLIGLSKELGPHEDFLEVLETRRGTPCCLALNLYDPEMVELLDSALEYGVEYHFLSEKMTLNQEISPVPTTLVDSSDTKSCRMIVKRPVSVTVKPTFMLTKVICTKELAYLFVARDDFAARKTKCWEKIQSGKKLFLVTANIYSLISLQGFMNGLTMKPLAISSLQQLNQMVLKPLSSASVRQLVPLADQIHELILNAKIHAQQVQSSIQLQPNGVKIRFLSLISLILGGDLYPAMHRDQAGVLLTLYLILMFNLLVIILMYVSKRCPSGHSGHKCHWWRLGCCCRSS